MKHFGYFIFILVSFGESCLLVSLCAGGWCGMAGSNEDPGRSMRPSVEDRDGQTCRVLEGWAVERLGGTVCSLHLARGD
jgi:hypothetical protein